MFLTEEQAVQARQTQIASLTSAMALGGKAVDGMQQVVDLNLGVTQAALQQVNLAVRQFAAAENPRQLLLLFSAQVQPNANRALDYGYYLTAIASDTQVDLIKLVSARVGEVNRRLIGMTEDAGKNAPGGVSVIAMASFLKSIFNAGRAPT